jgi:hypothetical protein
MSDKSRIIELMEPASGVTGRIIVPRPDAPRLPAVPLDGRREYGPHIVQTGETAHLAQRLGDNPPAVSDKTRKRLREAFIRLLDGNEKLADLALKERRQW